MVWAGIPWGCLPRTSGPLELGANGTIGLIATHVRILKITHLIYQWIWNIIEVVPNIHCLLNPLLLCIKLIVRVPSLRTKTYKDKLLHPSQYCPQQMFGCSFGLEMLWPPGTHCFHCLVYPHRLCTSWTHGRHFWRTLYWRQNWNQTSETYSAHQNQRHWGDSRRSGAYWTRSGTAVRRDYWWHLPELAGCCDKTGCTCSVLYKNRNNFVCFDLHINYINVVFYM